MRKYDQASSSSCSCEGELAEQDTHQVFLITKIIIKIFTKIIIKIISKIIIKITIKIITKIIFKIIIKSFCNYQLLMIIMIISC